MKRCPYDCNTCPYVQPGRTVKVTATTFRHDIESSVDCHTSNLIYCISCDRCPDQYVGETGKALSQRFAQHRGYVRNNKIDQATGENFNLPGHGLPNMKVTILEK